MRSFILAICLLIAYATFAQRTVRVVDSSDRLPLAAATVFSANGSIIGLTDDNGTFTAASDNVYPLTVRYLGYDAAKVGKDATVVEMSPSSLTLGEITVTPADRPVMHVTFYVREYASGATPTDTMIFFNEHMADTFVSTIEKVKGFKEQSHPRFLSSNLYTRLADSSGLDSCFVPDKRNNDLCFDMLLNIPYSKARIDVDSLTDVYRDSVVGKYGLQKTLKLQNGILYLHKDALADYEGHKYSPSILKLLGMTADFTDISVSMAYRANDSGEFDSANALLYTLAIKLTGRGRLFKHYFNTHGNPIDIYNYYELYPVDIQYLTVEEAKQMQKNPPRPAVIPSPNAPALDAPYQRIVDICRSAAPAGS